MHKIPRSMRMQLDAQILITFLDEIRTSARRKPWLCYPCHDGGEAQKSKRGVIAHSPNPPSGRCHEADEACQRTGMSR